MDAAAGLTYSSFFLKTKMLAYILCTALAVLPLLIYFRNPYFLKDLHCTFLSIYVGIRLSRIEKKFYSILDRFLDKVAEHPHKKFIVYEESSYTYSQADRESNKVARALLTHAHLKEGDTVALFLGNEPWFVWIWLALSKLGCTASFLNVNIRSKSLLHCFSCCEAKVLIAGAGKMRKYCSKLLAFVLINLTLNMLNIFRFLISRDHIV